MKKAKLLNSEISYEIAKLGHTQTLTIGDAGLPAPAGVKKIDLAVSGGVPGLLQVLDAVISEMCVEQIYLAEETQEQSPQIHEEIVKRFPGIRVDYIRHEQFKVMTRDTRALIRTGETTPYSNVILVSGVTF